MYIWGIHISMRNYKGSKQDEVYMSWTKEKGGGGLGLLGEVR